MFSKIAKEQRSHPILSCFQIKRIEQNSKKKKGERKERKKNMNLLSFRIFYIYILPCSDFCNETKGQLARCSKLIFISLDCESGELSRRGFETSKTISVVTRFLCLLFCNFSLLCFIISPLFSLSRPSEGIAVDFSRYDTEESNERETREGGNEERKREKEEKKWTNRRATKKKKKRTDENDSRWKNVETR